MRPNVCGRRATLALGFALALTRCGESDGDGPDSGTLPTQTPVFAVCAFITGPDGLTGVVSTVPSIDSDGVFDPSTAIAFGGRPICASDGRALFVSDPEAPNITRYTLNADNRLVPGETVSFAGFGTGPLEGIQPELMQFITDDRAYFVDVALGQLIVWNPNEMTTIGVIDLSIQTPEGLMPAGIGGIARRGNQLILPFAYRTPDGLNASTTSFAFIDTTTDEVTVDTVDSCGAVQTALTTESGDTYFASNAFAAGNHRLELAGSFPPCLVRARVGAGSIDRSFGLDLRSLVGGSMAASLLQGPSSSGFLTAYDESVVPIGDDLTSAELIGIPAWRLHRVDGVGMSTTATPVLGVPLGGGRITGIVVDGRTLIVVPDADFSGATAYDITEASETVEATEAISAPAFLYSAVQLR